MSDRNLIYLASPYSHPSVTVREDRFERVCRAAGELMRLGYMVFSPIAHSHAIGKLCDLPKDWAFWERQDTAILARCTSMIVLMLDGWEQSVGIQAEVEFAQRRLMPIAWVHPDEVASLPGPDDAYLRLRL